MLTKSAILAHRQCPKRLWLQTHRPELAVEDEDDTMQQINGIRIGEVARGLYGKGHLITAYDAERALAETAERLSAQDGALFEAAFYHDDVLVRADILKPGAKSNKNSYELIEVKSGSSLKDTYIEDAALQAWVITQSGAPLKATRIACVDTDFVYQGDGCYDGLLQTVDITAQAKDIGKAVPGWIKAAHNTLAEDEPDIAPGEQCQAPWPCPFVDYCCQEESDEVIYEPTVLPGRDGKALGRELIAQGYDDLRDVPGKLLEKPLHQRIWRASRSGRTELDNAVKAVLDDLPTPFYYLDFESFNPAAPLWKDSRPYQHIVFQWSCHIENRNGGLRHEEWLAKGDVDPRREFAESLIRVVKKRGAIIVYYQGFEKARIRELAELYPDLQTELEAINARIVDLLPITREHYYHPAMRGSWSIKRVLPTIAPELAYDELAVGDGGMAMQAFYEIIDPATPAERVAQLRRDLLVYCERDTYAMVRIVQHFREHQG